MTPSRWHPLLQCYWESWWVSGPFELTLALPAENACDMTGCITVALSLDARVETIRVTEGGQHDITYSRRPNTTDWQAHNERRWSKQP